LKHQTTFPFALTYFRENRRKSVMDGFELSFHGAEYPLPGGYDGLAG
jgi:hypothetical protein